MNRTDDRQSHGRGEQPERPMLITARHLPEPLLQFCGGRDSDPRRGLSMYGPFSLGQPRKHPRSLRIGLLGSQKTIAAAQRWLEECAAGVGGDEDHQDFPGCTSDVGFFCDLEFDDGWIHAIPQREQERALAIDDHRVRFETTVGLIEQGLAWFGALDHRPDVVIVALPDEIVEQCRTVDYVENGVEVHRDLRRAIKVAAMRHHLTTQLLLTRTPRGGRFVDHPSKVAWNFFTALYFKRGLQPWAPVGLDPETCYVGVSFFRPLGSKDTVRASMAQAFSAHGDAIVLRGQEFPWDPSTHGRSPHLDAAHAERLLGLVLNRYTAETQGRRPRRVVLHKSSRFTRAELEGFRRGLDDVRLYDFAAIARDDRVRLLRLGQYPVLRGTHFTVGEHEYLYTTGFLAGLDVYPHGHLPSALRVTDRHGDSPLDTLLREILILTKMNWNSADFAASLPITLDLARDVGDIMRELPADQEPLANFKYYV